MKKAIFLFSVVIFCVSCQEEQAPKQYFEDAPEIEICKKVINGYLSQDWESVRSCYCDTARIWNNVWYTSDPGITIDKEIEGARKFLSSVKYYSYEDAIWEMIVKNNGDIWVHFWGKWVGKLTEGSDELNVTVHIAFGVVGDKIVYEAGVWDNLPMYLAQQASEPPKE